MLGPLLAAVLATGPDPADAVRAADVAMAQAAGARDAAAFADCVDAEAIFVGGHALVRGRAAVVESWRRYLSPAGERLSWTPERAVVASSGDLAFTTGSYVWEGEVRPGEPGRETGSYVTVWRRGETGAWRALLDAPLATADRRGADLAREVVLAAASRDGDLEATAGTWSRGAEHGAFLTVKQRARATPVVDAVVVFHRASP